MLGANSNSSSTINSHYFIGYVKNNLEWLSSKDIHFNNYTISIININLLTKAYTSQYIYIYIYIYRTK